MIDSVGSGDARLPQTDTAGWAYRLQLAVLNLVAGTLSEAARSAVRR